MRVPLRGSDVRRRYSLRYTSRSTSHESSASRKTGELSERSKVPHSKCGLRRIDATWVRIPCSPLYMLTLKAQVFACAFVVLIPYPVVRPADGLCDYRDVCDDSDNLSFHPQTPRGHGFGPDLCPCDRGYLADYGCRDSPGSVLHD